MKHFANPMMIMTTMLLALGGAAIYGQQMPVKMTFSGTNVATAINLQNNTVTDEIHLAGDGTFGAFTFRELHADGDAAQPPAGCTGPNFGVVTGTGVFRFEDGSLLIVAVKDGTGCIDLSTGTAAIIINYEIKGGTRRFERASGNLKMTSTLAVVLGNAAGDPALLTNSGAIEGTIAGNR